MENFKDRLEENLEPIWGALLSAISALYGLWPVINLYETLIVKGGGGLGWILFVIGGLFAFAIVIAMTIYPLGWLMLTIENFAARGVICFVMVVVFLFARGVPPLIGLVVIAFVTVAGYYQATLRYQDGQDRREFLDE